MPILDRYERLEAAGIWREHPGAEPREVIVTFGHTTLMLSDTRERLLGHWALAGIQILSEDGGSVTYAMDDEGWETLTLRDRQMIDAIAGIFREVALPARAAPARRVPWGLLVWGAALAGLAAMAPDAIENQAVRMVSPEQATELGDRVLITLMEQGGGLCREPEGTRALDRLAERIAPEDPALRLRVLSLGGPGAAALPGDTILIDRQIVTGAANASEVAGWIALGLQRDPVRAVFAESGVLADARYIFTGDMPPAPQLGRIAEILLGPPAPGELNDAIDLLERRGIATGPFLAAILERSDAALPGEGAAATAVSEPLLSDQQWVALAGICG